MIQFQGEDFRCHMEITLRLIGGKWKALLLWHLGLERILRFNELSRLHPKLTPKMLTQQLRELEEDGIITRHVYHQVPPKVEYALSKHGEALLPVLTQMCAWGENYLQITTPAIGSKSCELSKDRPLQPIRPN